MNAQVLELGYLLAAACFIFGLKYLGSPRTAPKGNQLGAVGMLLAVIVTLLQMGAEQGGIMGWELILSGLVLGSAIGAVMAIRVQMTGMPEMVALFNGFGGGASALVALSEIVGADFLPKGQTALGQNVFVVAICASTLIGWSTLTGSLMAMFKLNGLMRKNIVLPGQTAIKGGLLLLCVILSYVLLDDPTRDVVVYILVAISCVLGVLLVIPIGGADMPVVISFLNSLSGLAACATGFVVNNNALIISGALVGAAGLILTGIMCKAMNRTFMDVLLKSYGEDSSASSGEKRSVQGYEADDAAMVFDGARSVIVVPGYGMAVSQAQHVVRELGEELASRGIDVRYAIHPVAGRMPGHMNVLLAEANVPYEQLYELDDINSSFSECDVCLVVGANDTINPAAHQGTGPLAGMPVLDVEKARTTIIVKRSLSPGYAGVDNDLFYRPTTMMLFGDGKKMLTQLLASVKAL